MVWFKVVCQYEDSRNQEPVEVLSEGETAAEAEARVREQSEQIRGLQGNTITTQESSEVGALTVSEVKDEVERLFGPDTALFETGSIYRFKYVGVSEWIEQSSLRAC